MTTSSGLSGGSLSPRPPSKGSFPLDHLSECRAFAKAYRACLDKHGRTATACRNEARLYLECRMQRGLMKHEEWNKLGLSDEATAAANDASDRAAGAAEPAAHARGESQAFVAGARAAKIRKERGEKRAPHPPP